MSNPQNQRNNTTHSNNGTNGSNGSNGSNSSNGPGTLYIVPTPIGNLEDITLRALRILKEVDLIAAEDTRHTRGLLSHFGIGTQLISYYREKEQERGHALIQRLQEGQSVALVSDAGTPAISDPGRVVVQLAHDAGISVVPLPGASALTTAISGSGLECENFLFLGFLPSKKNQRRQALDRLVNLTCPAVLYESPRRIEELMRDALKILGDRTAFWGRELTKNFEELQHGTLRQLLEKATDGQNRGEFVVIICPGKQEEAQGETVEELLAWYRDNSEMSLKDVSRRLAEDLGLSRSAVYQQALEIWKAGE